MDWKKYNFGDKVRLLSGGTPSKSKKEYWGGHIPWVSTKDLVTDRIYETQDYLTDLGSQNGTRRVTAGTILMSVRGMRLANELPISMVMCDATFNQDLKAIIPNGDVDNLFLFYWIKGNEYEIKGLADEAAHGTKRIQTDRLMEFALSLPPLETQHRIAAILSAYDDLIENNTRRIKALEQAAHDLYREWFVEFRFPGHESVEMVDSGTDYGMIPQGWEVVPLREIAEVNASNIRTGDGIEEIEYIDISSVSSGRIDETRLIPFDEAPSRARRKVTHGDTIWATVRPNRRQYALILHPAGNLIASTGFAVISPNSVGFSYLYEALTTEEFAEYLTNRATGSAYPAVNAGDFNDAQILLPDDELTRQYHFVVSDMHEKKHVLTKKNHALREARDLLLPRLVSGQLDVSDIEVGIDTE